MTVTTPRTGVVTLGETMALLATPGQGPLRTGVRLGLRIGGAESNVAIALARLGVPATWVGRVGADLLGDLVAGELRAEGVDVVATRDAEAPTGLMLKEVRGGRARRVRYYRSGSAGSRLAPSELPEHLVASAAVLHVTGVTAALGAAPLATLERAVAVAREAGTLVSFDVNHRSTLWSAANARPTLARLVAAADLVFAGVDEAALVLGHDPGTTASLPPADAARALVALGPREVVLKQGAAGATAVRDDESHSAAPEPVDAADPVGAGDAFVGGYLAALVAGHDIPHRLRLGNALGAAVCAAPGDWEGLPTVDELAGMLGRAPTWPLLEASEVLR